MTRIRRTGAIMLAAPLAMAFPLLGASIPAKAASTSVLYPENGAVIRSGSQLTASAEFDFALDMHLRADIPGAGNTFLAKRSLAGKLSGTIPLRRNGVYRVFLQGGITKHVYDSNTFTVRIPPARPGGVSAKVSGGKLSVRWNLGLEDDISGYTVTAGPAGSKSGSAGALCGGSSCSTTFSLPSGTTGTVPVTVRAKRPDGVGGSVSSASASTSVTVPSTPRSPLGSLPSSAPGSPSTVGNAPLTPFNQKSPVTLPYVQPDGAVPGIAYPAPQVADRAKPKAGDASAISSLEWGKSLGIALVLLVLAAHLGMWTRRMRVAQAGLSEKGKAARTARSGTGRTRVRRAREQIARAEAAAKMTKLPESQAADKPSARRCSGDTPVKQALRESAVSQARHRPATLGTAASGVSVRIASSSAGGRRSGRGERRRRR
ncbi:hypothetical protein Acsp03_71260 [Actinomadura sp. NBRC 104412]|uniref:hypothetical protein n=1 Tax=Actinomadura sp. NBRC 104412 TaxID=3032203 RepID=UPI0024A47187|nr:hypothetical protein [Actinomadura sp. NBRC 104412]GLZ09660.1 hypothetical protein Acsp03_71260 [Actinomadura sp. NBRC 104412]